MGQTVELLHHIRGRLRLRLAFTKRNPEQLRNIQGVLAGMAGVQRVDVNPTLGTLVVHYDPALFAGFVRQLADFAAQHELFQMACGDAVPCISETDRSVKRFFGEMNHRVQEATKDFINLKELLPLALAGYGFLFVDRAAAAAQWLNWIQFAFDTYLDLHEEEPVEELGERVEAIGAEIIERQDFSAQTLRAEVAALRAELHRLVERLPR